MTSRLTSYVGIIPSRIEHPTDPEVYPPILVRHNCVFDAVTSCQGIAIRVESEFFRICLFVLANERNIAQEVTQQSAVTHLTAHDTCTGAVCFLDVVQGVCEGKN